MKSKNIEFMKCIYQNRHKLLQNIIIVLFCIIVILTSNSNSIWGDEAYSLNAIRTDWRTVLMAGTELDNGHPPFYFWYLKAMTDILKYIGVKEIMAAKLSSTIPYLIMLIIGKSLNKVLGEKTVTIWMLFMLGMPNMLTYSIEIRMYSMAMMLVFVAFLIGYNVAINPGNIRMWIFITTFSIIAAYTHYYACVAVAFVYLGILVYGRKEAGILIKWTMSVIICVLAYSVWLIKAFNFVGNTDNDGWWFPKVSADLLKTIYKFYFEPRIDILNVNVVLGALCFIACVIMTIFCVKTKKLQTAYWYSGIVMAVGSLVLWILVSVLFRPILVPRYLIVTMPCFWLSIALETNELVEKVPIKNIVAIMIMIFFIIDVTQFVRWENINKRTYEAFDKFTENINDEDILGVNGILMHWCLQYYFPQNEIIYFYKGEYDLEQENLNYYFEVYKEGSEVLKRINNIYTTEKEQYFWLEFQDVTVYELTYDG